MNDEKKPADNIWASDIFDGATYETNEFGDSWKRGPSRAKTEKELDWEHDRQNFNFWCVMTVMVIIPALFWIWIIIGFICKAFGYNIFEGA